MSASTSLYSLVYRSRATRTFDEAALATLLQKARFHNQAAWLSGLLLHYQGQFLQVLEGTEPALSDLYGRIQADPRHHHVRTLAYGPIEARAFPDWRMGFAPANGSLLAQVVGFLPLVKAPGLATHPPAALSQLLHNFARGQAQDQ
jgi:hypothetical protein